MAVTKGSYPVIGMHPNLKPDWGAVAITPIPYTLESRIEQSIPNQYVLAPSNSRMVRCVVTPTVTQFRELRKLWWHNKRGSLPFICAWLRGKYLTDVEGKEQLTVWKVPDGSLPPIHGEEPSPRGNYEATNKRVYQYYNAVREPQGVSAEEEAQGENDIDILCYFVNPPKLRGQYKQTPDQLAVGLEFIAMAQQKDIRQTD